MYKLYLKRLLDIILSFTAIIILSPIFIVISLTIKMKLGSPVIFSQNRPGLSEKVFRMYKFRSMSNEVDQFGNLLPDEKRLTTFGKMLRSTSLDELPELFNILKGDMSIVGPRPQLVKDMFFMTDEQRKRHSVRQGLTGLAQVNGRNNVTWEDKINKDLEYIERITFINDCKIIFKTIQKVFKRDDIATDGMDTAEDLGDYLLRTKQISNEEYANIVHSYEERVKS